MFHVDGKQEVSLTQSQPLPSVLPLVNHLLPLVGELQQLLFNLENSFSSFQSLLYLDVQSLLYRLQFNPDFICLCHGCLAV